MQIIAIAIPFLAVLCGVPAKADQVFMGCKLIGHPIEEFEDELHRCGGKDSTVSFESNPNLGDDTLVVEINVPDYVYGLPWKPKFTFTTKVGHHYRLAGIMGNIDDDLGGKLFQKSGSDVSVRRGTDGSEEASWTDGGQLCLSLTSYLDKRIVFIITNQYFDNMVAANQ